MCCPPFVVSLSNHERTSETAVLDSPAGLESGSNSLMDRTLAMPAAFMNFIVQILVGALTGWLTGKVVEVEGRVNVVREGHVWDTIYGIIGALIGEHLFFWIVIGKGSSMSELLTAILGSITVVGAARLLTDRWRRVQF